MKKALLIFNPVSGTNGAGDYVADLINQLTRQGYLTQALATQKEGDEEAFIQALGEEQALIVILGGDGTLSHAVRGLVGLKNQPDLAYLPAGSTNDFAQGIGLGDLDQEQTIACASAGEAYPVDAGLFNETPFLYVAAFGLFTAVSYRTSQEQKNSLGRLAYMLEGIKDLSQMKPYHLKIQTEKQEMEGAFLLGIIANSNSIAGFQMLSHEADYNDGQFEVMLLEASLGALDLAAAIHDLVSGTENPHILRFQAQKLEIHAKEKLAWTLDGEEGEKGHTAQIRVLEGALRFRLPEETHPASKS